MTDQKAEPELKTLYQITGNAADINTVLINRGEFRNLRARVAELEAQLESIGAGGVSPLMAPASASQSSGIPPNWRPVPPVPTQAMLTAWQSHFGLIEGAYAAMLAAAPQPSMAEQPQGGQEPDWQDLYSKEKRRAEMWIAKYEKDVGKLEVAVPVAAQPQAEQEPDAFYEWWSMRPSLTRLQAWLLWKNQAKAKGAAS